MYLLHTMTWLTQSCDWKPQVTWLDTQSHDWTLFVCCRRHIVMLLILSHMTKLLEWHYLPYWQLLCQKKHNFYGIRTQTSRTSLARSTTQPVPHDNSENKIRIYKVNCKDLSNLHSNYYCQCHNIMSCICWHVIICLVYCHSILGWCDIR